MHNSDKQTLAGIEYAGLPGISRDCRDAVMRLIQYGDRITRTRVLSCSGDHCLLLTVNAGDLIAIKSGFGSGYLGEGSHTFSYILQLLETHGSPIEEYEVAPEIIERIDNSSLTRYDIEKLGTTVPIRPTRWYTYVFEQHLESERNGTLWQKFPPIIPLAIIDGRIIDLAISFWEGPDEKLLTGYRRLEDIVRKRTGIDEHGAKLFSQAFAGPKAKLSWKDPDASEQVGKASLFTGAFMAYRNPRAHREVQDDTNNQLAEFLLLNHLYCLERSSIERSIESNM